MQSWNNRIKKQKKDNYVSQVLVCTMNSSRFVSFYVCFFSFKSDVNSIYVHWTPVDLQLIAYATLVGIYFSQFYFFLLHTVCLFVCVIFFLFFAYSMVRETYFLVIYARTVIVQLLTHKNIINLDKWQVKFEGW